MPDLIVTVYVKICFTLNLHVKTPVLLKIIFLSRKYIISSSDWTTDLAILLKKLEIKFHSKQNRSDAATVKEFCNMKDNADFNLLSSSEISKLVDDICID